MNWVSDERESPARHIMMYVEDKLDAPSRLPVVIDEAKQHASAHALSGSILQSWQEQPR